MVALNVLLYAQLVTSIVTTALTISVADVISVRTVASQAVGVMNVTTAVTVLKQYATAVTVAPIVPQYVLNVMKNAQIVQIRIYAVAVTPVLTV